MIESNFNTCCGSFVRASTISTEPDVQAATCKGVILPSPTIFGVKMSVIKETSRNDFDNLQTIINIIFIMVRVDVRNKGLSNVHSVI